MNLGDIVSVAFFIGLLGALVYGVFAIISESKNGTKSKGEADRLYDEIDAFSEAAHLVATDFSVSADEIAEAFDRINGNGPVERTVERTVRSNNPNPDYAPPMGKPKEPLMPRQCPNCGAPVRGHKCEYCDSVFEHGKDDFILTMSTSFVPAMSAPASLYLYSDAFDRDNSGLFIP